jgi:hypothetical protein
MTARLDVTTPKDIRNEIERRIAAESNPARLSTLEEFLEWLNAPITQRSRAVAQAEFDAAKSFVVKHHQRDRARAHPVSGMIPPRLGPHRLRRRAVDGPSR